MCEEELDREEERLEELTKLGDQEALIALLWLLYRRHKLQKYCDMYNTYYQEPFNLFQRYPTKIYVI
jgi:hypothetical protein